METEPKKTNWWGIGGILGLGVLIASGFASEPTTIPVNTVTPSTVDTKIAKPIDTWALQQKGVTDTVSNTKNVPATVDTSVNLSNDNYYKNVDGNTVHAPAYSNDVPAGASARCRDGTYSFSQHRSGTCSRHGGVSMWL